MFAWTGWISPSLRCGVVSSVLSSCRRMSCSFVAIASSISLSCRLSVFGRTDILVCRLVLDPKRQDDRQECPSYRNTKDRRKTAPAVRRAPPDLLHHFNHHARAHRLAALADGEAQRLVHGDR